MQKSFKTYMLGTVLLLMIGGKLCAQQDFINGFYMYNPLGFNPAIAGADDRLVASAIYRNQWAGLNGAPVTMYANFHAPFAELVSKQRSRYSEEYPTGVSIGLSLAKDEIGASEMSVISVPLAIRVRINDAGDRFSFGVKPLLNVFTGNFAELRQDAGDDIGVDFETQTFVDFDLGWYYYNKYWYAGISVTNLREINIIKEYGYYRRRHYFASAGYAFFMSDHLMLRSTMLVAATAYAPVSFTLSPTLIIQQRFHLGVAYRYGDMIGANAAMNLINELKIGYAYEYPLGSKTNRIGYTHEVMLSYAFTKYRNKVVSPRFFW